MSTFLRGLRPLGRTDSDAPPDGPGWVWDGLFARGDLSLLTSVWKTGKTTLLAGLLRALGGGGEFLGRACPAGRAVVVSEESWDIWGERERAIPGGPHARVLARPFLARPTAAEWDDLVREAEDLRADGPLDLFVVDTLGTFFPGRSESDAGALLDFLAPLRRLAAGGTAVLVHHHPRRAKSAEGSLARGGGALLGAVDAVLELHFLGRIGGNRRRLTCRSRRPGAVAELAYEWVEGTAEFRAVPTDAEAVFRESWEQVRVLLADRPAPATCPELLADWSLDAAPPSRTVLYGWLRRATASGLAVRTGDGTKRDPFRFALPRPRQPGELPPLPPLRRPGT